jgi:hypothetical protein
MERELCRPANAELAAFGDEAERVIGLQLRSKTATIGRLLPAIDRYLALGYSLRQLLAVLLASGLPPTSLSTLQSAMSRQRTMQARHRIALIDERHALEKR